MSSRFYEQQRDGIVRMAAIAFRRYSAQPDERLAASRLLFVMAAYLYASHISPDEALELLVRTQLGEEIAA